MSEVFDGTVDIQNSSGSNTTLTLHGDLGQIVVFDAAGAGRIFLDGQGTITTGDAALHPVTGLHSTGEVIISRVLGADTLTVLRFLAAQASLSIGDEGTNGTVNVRNLDGDDAVVLDGRDGNVTVRRNVDGTLRDVLTFEGATAALHIGSEDNGGRPVRPRQRRAKCVPGSMATGRRCSSAPKATRATSSCATARAAR